MIGLKRGTVKLAKNTPKWKESFEREKRKLKKTFGKFALNIQHVGSTAIPGILAKPIIDIGVVVPSLKQAKKYIKALKQMGYILKKEDRSDRLFFTKGSERKRTHYLHIGKVGSGYVEDMILFRDYLRKNKKAAASYDELKRRLSDKHRKRRDLYTAKKEKLVKSIVRKAKNPMGGSQ